MSQSTTKRQRTHAPDKTELSKLDKQVASLVASIVQNPTADIYHREESDSLAELRGECREGRSLLREGLQLLTDAVRYRKPAPLARG